MTKTTGNRGTQHPVGQSRAQPHLLPQGCSTANPPWAPPPPPARREQRELQTGTSRDRGAWKPPETKAHSGHTPGPQAQTTGGSLNPSQAPASTVLPAGPPPQPPPPPPLPTRAAPRLLSPPHSRAPHPLPSCTPNPPRPIPKASSPSGSLLARRTCALPPAPLSPHTPLNESRGRVTRSSTPVFPELAVSYGTSLSLVHIFCQMG